MTHILKIQIPPNLRGGRALLAGSTKHVVMCRALCHGRAEHRLSFSRIYFFIFFKKKGDTRHLFRLYLDKFNLFKGLLRTHAPRTRYLYKILFHRLFKKKVDPKSWAGPTLLAQLSRVLKGCQMADILHDRA